MNNHHAIRPMAFSNDGNANRRDDDAEPRVLVIAVDFDADQLHYHQAGDGYVRSVPFLELTVGDELIAGMTPFDAFLVGGCVAESMRQDSKPAEQEQTGDV